MYLEDLVEYYKQHDADKDTKSWIGFVVGFAMISFFFLILTILIVLCNWNCKEFYEWNAIRITMPAITLFLCVQNATLAFDYQTENVNSHWAIVVYLMSSTIAPGIFIYSFVMTFLAYRTRSMPFCFVHRGPSRHDRDMGDEDDEVYQPLVRPAILIVSTRGFAFCLLVLNLLINFNVLSDDTLVGLAGWSTVVMNANLNDNSTLMILISLLPMTFVCCLCLYFAFLLWRYGCEFSMVINSSFINAWILPLFGSVAMLIGQMFGPDFFLVTSNTGILLYTLSMVRVLYEIRHDIREAGDLGDFLNALEKTRSEQNEEGNKNGINNNTGNTPGSYKTSASTTGTISGMFSDVPG